MTYQEKVIAEINACVEVGIYSKAKAKKAAAYVATKSGQDDLAEYEQSGCRLSDAADLIVQLA